MLTVGGAFDRGTAAAAAAKSGRAGLEGKRAARGGRGAGESEGRERKTGFGAVMSAWRGTTTKTTGDDYGWFRGSRMERKGIRAGG